jgi:hypothetical protein
MKQGSLKFICLVIWACITVLSVHGQYRAEDLRSWVLESFNGNGDSIYKWRTEANRFISKTDRVTYPLVEYIEAYPSQAFRKGVADGTPRSLGINARFDRRGYNWIDIYPVLADDPEGVPVGIPVPGKLKRVDMWVWGSNLRYYMEIFLKDYQGVIHVLNFGSVYFKGWRNMSVNVPGNINQMVWTESEPLLRGKELGLNVSDNPQFRDEPAYPSLHFVKFRLWTQPVERVENFYIYFKQLKILTDINEALFDGWDLADPNNIQKFWSNAGSQ